MSKSKLFATASAGVVGAMLLIGRASATDFNIPGGDLKTVLDAYASQAGVPLIYSGATVRGTYSKGATGDLSSDAALNRILVGTGFVIHREADAIAIVRGQSSNAEVPGESLQLAQVAPSSRAVETVTVTSSKLGSSDVQSIPIAITALSQEQLTATQTAGGPDLVKQVPNLTFTKTNFTGYSINIRGIGTQAISVTTDPAVAVALNDIPFIRNHFFEQEFYDLSQAEVLRGPQGTLFGRNATAGVVNLVTAKPTDQFEAMASGELGNYHQRRFEGMINLPIVDDRLDIRIAGEWTKRQGYSFNALTDQRIDGRDLWSGRVSIGWKPFDNVQTTLVWEHFSEGDDRMRTAKQLCKTAPIPASVDGVSIGNTGETFASADYLSQGCLPTSLYSADAFEVPNGYSLSYYEGLQIFGIGRIGFDVYSDTTQSRNLRVIESSIDPAYKAKNDTVEWNTDIQVTPALTLTSQTGFAHDFLWSTEDYNRFNSAPGAFICNQGGEEACANGRLLPDPGVTVCTQFSDCEQNAGIFCDPQLGCSDRLVAQDISDEHAWQLSHEFRLASNFSGPMNFSVGGSYLHYETEENYYVFINALTLFSALSPTPTYTPGVSDNGSCLLGGFRYPDPSVPQFILNNCRYIDPNSLTSLNNQGHNYFLSQNPYALNSYATFGEVYYNVLSDLKLTAGLRWTEDRKHFLDIPSELIVPGYGYAITNIINQQWDELTGRAAINWTPRLNFTDQTLVYGSYAHGYKAGGANPPGAIFPTVFEQTEVFDPIHPLTFKPEFIDAFELGSKNIMLDGALTLNADIFYYNYENYQISEIVDRTAINQNFDAHVKGAEVESTWEPLAGLRFNFAGGWEDGVLAKGSHAVDLMDRTAGNPDWIVVKPYITQATNCILPTYVVAALLQDGGTNTSISQACSNAYSGHQDPLTGLPYVQNPTVSSGGNSIPAGYPGFDPVSPSATNPDHFLGNDAGPAPNNGQGFDKSLSGNKLPNAPPLTVSAGAQYTIPLSSDWAGTLREDYYWQDYSWARVFNDNPYDRLRGYTNLNLTLILTNQNGWQVMLYDKNVFNTTAITGDFLNSDDSGLTTNVFLTDPKLIGIRVTKNW